MNTKIFFTLAFSIGAILSSLAFSQAVAQEKKNWEDGGKVAAENDSFMGRVKALQKQIENIIEDIEVTNEYCNRKGCWESINYGQNITFTGESEKWESINFAQSLTKKYGGGSTWASENFGQSLQYGDASGMEWQSENEGQALSFSDGRGNMWESQNFGQVLHYEGVNGEWDSTNFGQSLQYNDTTKRWESLNFGQQVEYDDTTGNSWDSIDLGNDLTE